MVAPCCCVDTTAFRRQCDSNLTSVAMVGGLCCGDGLCGSSARQMAGAALDEHCSLIRALCCDYRNGFGFGRCDRGDRCASVVRSFSCGLVFPSGGELAKSGAHAIRDDCVCSLVAAVLCSYRDENQTRPADGYQGSGCGPGWCFSLLLRGRWAAQLLPLVG